MLPIHALSSLPLPSTLQPTFFPYFLALFSPSLPSSPSSCPNLLHSLPALFYLCLASSLFFPTLLTSQSLYYFLPLLFPPSFINLPSSLSSFSSCPLLCSPLLCSFILSSTLSRYVFTPLSHSFCIFSCRTSFVHSPVTPSFLSSQL